MPRGHAAFAYVFEGGARFGGQNSSAVTGPLLVVLGEGDTVEARTDNSSARFLLVSGKPLNEPISRYGLFVMNTREEIEQTLRELQQGTFAR